MPTSIVEQIAAAVKTVIESVTTANGYAFNVEEVVRPTRMGGYVPRPGLVVLTQGDWDADDEHSTFSKVRRILPMRADVYIRPSDTDTTAMDTYTNAAAADLEKALCLDRTLGGLALMVRVRPPESFITA